MGCCENLNTKTERRTSMIIISGLPINKFCRNLVASLCTDAISKQQFDEERQQVFPETDNLFEFHKAKLRREALVKQ